MNYEIEKIELVRAEEKYVKTKRFVKMVHKKCMYFKHEGH